MNPSSPTESSTRQTSALAARHIIARGVDVMAKWLNDPSVVVVFSRESGVAFVNQSEVRGFYGSAKTAPSDIIGRLQELGWALPVQRSSILERLAANTEKTTQSLAGFMEMAKWRDHGLCVVEEVRENAGLISGALPEDFHLVFDCFDTKNVEKGSALLGMVTRAKEAEQLLSSQPFQSAVTQDELNEIRSMPPQERKERSDNLALEIACLQPVLRDKAETLRCEIEQVVSIIRAGRFAFGAAPMEKLAADRHLASVNNARGIVESETFELPMERSVRQRILSAVNSVYDVRRVYGRELDEDLDP